MENRMAALVLIGGETDIEKTKAIMKFFKESLRRSIGVRNAEISAHQCPVAIIGFRPQSELNSDTNPCHCHDGSPIYYVSMELGYETLLCQVHSILNEADAEAKHAEIFIGRSKAICDVSRLIRTYANSTLPVLILGETGTGKELTAKALHDFSRRRNASFIAMNCAAIPDSLIESELFGTEKGAFTDAVRRRGAFAMAEKGTLFLDEIGSLSIAAQPHLLRVLESGEYWKLGGESIQRADFRLVSASCQSPIDLAEKNMFRSDLLYRITNLLIEIPPLRERKEDIELLARHFCKEASNASREISSTAMDKLNSYHWPGNVRELKSTVTRAVVDSTDSRIGPDGIRFLHAKRVQI
jgi:transcriptional regulator with PAS, ATPase and Fis domain